MIDNNSPLSSLTDDPVELKIISIKSKLMILVASNIRKNGWTQSQAAKELNVNQPRISNLMNGQLSKFSVDMLISMLGQLNYIIDVSFDLSSESPLSIKMKKPTAVTVD